jgi:hypothetical protein
MSTQGRKGTIDENAIDGNFYQTENEYTILVYYREIAQIRPCNWKRKCELDQYHQLK